MKTLIAMAQYDSIRMRLFNFTSKKEGKVMKKLITLFTMITMLAVLTACGEKESTPVEAETKTTASAEVTTEASTETSTETEETGRLAEIKASGKLVLATGNYRPFEYRDEETNEMIGYDIDLARMFADELGVELVINDMTFTSLIPTLQNGNADLIIAAMYIKPEREEVVDFADPYMDTGVVLVVRDETNDISITEDLEGKKVGAKLGGTSEKVAQEMLDEGMNFEMFTYKENTEALLDLANGRVDVVINDLLYQLEYNKTHPGLKIMGEPFTKAQLGIAVQDGDEELLAFINERLDAYQADGTTDALYKKWISGEE